MIKRILCLALSGTGILALLGVFLFTWLWVQIDRFGQVDRARRADVIVVLGARVWPSGRWAWEPGLLEPKFIGRAVPDSGTIVPHPAAGL
jgi:hypothetical protein